MKGQLKDHFSCQIIDQIFQKQTQNCQCEVLSPESSEISFGQFDDDDDNDEDNDDDDDDDDGQFDQSLPPSLTDTDESEFSDQDSTYSTSSE